MIKRKRPTKIDSYKRGQETLRLFDFTGGLNTTADPSLILDNETPYAINCIAETDGIVTRDGYTKLWANSLGNSKIQGGAKFYKVTGDERILIAHNGIVYDNTGTAGALKSIKTSLNTANHFDFCPVVISGNDYMVFTDRAANLQKYDGTNVTELVARTGKFPVWHKQRLFIVDPTDKNTLLASVTGNPADFTTLSADPDTTPYSTLLGKGDGDVVMWLGVVNDNITALKRNSTYVVFSSENAFNVAVEQAPSGVGTVSGESVGKYKGVIFYAAEDGVYTFDGSLTWKISQKIQPDYDAIANKSGIVGVCYKGWYYMAYTVSGGTYNTEVLAYNIDDRSWWKFTGIHANCFIPFVYGDDTEELYFGDSAVGLVYKMFTGTNDNGVAIPMEFRTKYLDMGMPERKKRHRRIYPHLKTSTGSTEFGYDHDFNNGPTYISIDTSGAGDLLGSTFILGTSVMGTPGLNTVRVPITGQARYTQFRVRNTVLDKVTKFLGISDYWKPRRPV